MGIKYGRGWGGARISLSQGSVLSKEYFPSSLHILLKVSFIIFQGSVVTFLGFGAMS